MATKRESDKIDEVDKRLGRLEVRVDEVLIPKLDQVVSFVEDNKSGIKTSSILNEKILTYVLGGVALAGVYLAAKGGL